MRTLSSLLGAALLLGLSLACAGDKRVNPPPEGEWLEWEPKQSKDKQGDPTVHEAPEKKKPAPPDKGKGGTEDLDAEPAKAKSTTATVKCNARDLTRESSCIALSELGGKTCPDKLPKVPQAKEAGSFEQPPKGAKRDPSLEASVKQCCYAWCGKIPAASPPVPCKTPEPLFCVEAPVAGTQHAAPPPYAECPMGLKKTDAKGRRKATPAAAFSSKLTKEERAGEPKACCYEACK